MRLCPPFGRCSLDPMAAASKTKAFQFLSIKEMMPLLASSYEAGRLVPFIGAGMSRRKLSSWKGFCQ